MEVAWKEPTWEHLPSHPEMWKHYRVEVQEFQECQEGDVDKVPFKILYSIGGTGSSLNIYYETRIEWEYYGQNILFQDGGILLYN